MNTTTVTIQGDLEAAFAAARLCYLDAVGSTRSDYPLWCRQIAAGRRAMAEIYATARDSVPIDGLLWHAFNDAENSLRHRANNLDSVADRHEQEGQ